MRGLILRSRIMTYNIRASAAPKTARVSTGSVKSSVSSRMKELKKNNKVAFIPYLCAGDPNLETTKKAIKILDDAKADIIELGIPYSDPLADGPVIHNAATRALEAGTKLDEVLDMLQSIIPNISAPIILFTYFNPILRRGLESFVSRIKEVGVSGLLVPDIPYEETGDIREICQKYGIELVLLATPTTPKERMIKIAELSQGFVYLVSVTGVTGVRKEVSKRVNGLVQMLHQVTDKPICVGFGVSGPEQAKEIVSYGAEGVIVGSSLVKVLGESSSQEEGLEKMTQLAFNLREAIP